MTYAHINNEKLAIAAQSGDGVATQRLLDRSEDTIKKVLKRNPLYTFDGESDDLLQRMRISVWQSIKNFDPRKGCWLQYVTTVARWRLITIYRSSIIVSKSADRYALAIDSLDDLEIPIDADPEHQVMIDNLKDLLIQHIVDQKSKIPIKIAREIAHSWFYHDSHPSEIIKQVDGVEKITIENMQYKMRAKWKKAGLSNIESFYTSKLSDVKIKCNNAVEDS